MSIQFLCVSCRKPIEVDDQWALQRAECPYCHDVVTVPGMSTYHEPSVPVATPVESVVFDQPSQDLPQPPPPVRSNRVAIVALVLACISIVLLFMINVYMASKLGDVLSPAAEGQDYDVQEFTEKFNNVLKSAIDRGEAWPQVLMLGVLFWLATWCAGLICAVVALSRPGRRGMSIAALVVSLFPALLFVLGLIV